MSERAHAKNVTQDDRQTGGGGWGVERYSRAELRSLWRGALGVCAHGIDWEDNRVLKHSREASCNHVVDQRQWRVLGLCLGMVRRRRPASSTLVGRGGGAPRLAAVAGESLEDSLGRLICSRAHA